MLQRLGHRAYAQVLADHHRLIRTALADHGGREVDTQGDSFFAVFSSPSAAAAAAIEMQRALGAYPWPGSEEVRARMGLHAGEAAEGPTGLVGLDVHRAARVAAIAHGGQVLLSEAGAALVRGALPAGATMRDLGWHHLKDFGSPEHIFQLEAPGLAARFSPLRSFGRQLVQHNLPAQLSTFIGREAQLARLRELLRSGRLVTLTGSGGTGKTRLALQAAAEEVEGKPDGVWFVDLAPLRSAAALWREVASVLGRPDGPDPSSVDRLVETLALRAPLIVLDNCEHLVEACARLVDRVLRACPSVVVLATSREPLGLAGEQVVRVPPLGLPNDNAGTDPIAEVTRSEAAALFVNRALALGDSFVVDNASAACVVSICRRLDGLPLALELAAARLRSMGVHELEGRLGDQLRLLSSGSRAPVSRQQTMRALIDWSYQLLDEPERAVFRRLSVFTGPFDLAAAGEVGRGDEVDRATAEDALFSLVEKSLVLPGTGSSFTRYRFLESVRQFAEEQLEAAGGEEHYGACARFVGHYAALAARAGPEMFGPNEEMWLERLAEEQPNLVAAFGYADRGMGTNDWGLALASHLYDYWLMEEPALGAEILEGALAHDTSSVPPALRAKAMWVLAEQLQHTGKAERATQLCLVAFTMAMAGGDLAAAAQCRKVAANAHLGRGERDQAAAFMSEAEELARRSGDEMTFDQVVHDSGIHRMSIGDIEGARARFEEALGRFEEAGARRHALMARVNLGNVAETTGDLMGARTLFQSVFEQLQDRRRGLIGPLAGLVSMNLSAISLMQGDADSALGYLPTVMTNSRFHPVETLLMVALFAGTTGHYETAGQLHGAADVLRQRRGLGASMTETGERHLESARAALRANPSVDFDSYYACGRRLGQQQALRLAGDFVSGLMQS